MVPAIRTVTMAHAAFYHRRNHSHAPRGVESAHTNPESPAARLDRIAAHFNRRISRDSLRIPCPAHNGENDNLVLWKEVAM